MAVVTATAMLFIGMSRVAFAHHYDQLGFNTVGDNTDPNVVMRSG
jgi:hypothetical protein